MKKYAMVAINWKQPSKGQLFVRRVLISYTSLQADPKDHRKEVYIHTRIIAKDEYFDDPTKSHQYIFENDGYILLPRGEEHLQEYKNYPELYEKRPYHRWKGENFVSWLPVPLFEDYHFKANTDAEAIEIFHQRTKGW